MIYSGLNRTGLRKFIFPQILTFFNYFPVVHQIKSICSAGHKGGRLIGLGEGNGNPFHYSCLKAPWTGVWATVQEVTEWDTTGKWLSTYTQTFLSKNYLWSYSLTLSAHICPWVSTDGSASLAEGVLQVSLIEWVLATVLKGTHLG